MASSLPLLEAPCYKAAQQNVNLNLGSFSPNEAPSLSNLETIIVLKSQYESLLRTAQKFENLKFSLLKGGVTLDNLNVLMNEPLVPVSNAHESTTNFHAQNVESRSNIAAGSGSSHHGEARTNRVSEEESIGDENDFCFDDREEVHNSERGGTDKSSAQFEQRSLEIRGLPERTTHLDLMNAIRGGAILEMYLKFFDHSARVSFTESSAAREFMAHVKNDGFYVCGKKVEVTWGERQFFLRPYIRQAIEHGASRNLVIRSVNPNITATLIRDHLDHIHNLVVIDIKFNKGNAYINTNSVHNAMFARSCMMSRTTYRGMRIEFSPDECARPYQKVYKIVKTAKTSVTKPPSISNRFQMLIVDESEDSNESENEDDDDDVAGISISSSKSE